MTDLTNNDPLPEEETDIEPEVHSRWSMLVTMLLLIAGFLFTSLLLMQQTLQAKTSTGEPVFSLQTLVEQSKSMMKPAAKNKDAETGQAPEENDVVSALADIKQMVIEKTSSDKVRWPRLKLTGFGKSADGSESFAYINGDLVHPGEYAGKVRLVEVRNHDVVVEYKGEHKNLTVVVEQ